MWRLLSDKITEVSTLTVIEYSYLLASLEARLVPSKFSCSQCARYKKESLREQKKRSKGCFDYTTRTYLIENIIYETCIGNFNTDIQFYIEAFSHYQKGMLPFKGNLSDQPNKIIEIFAIIDQRIEDKRKENN